MKRVVVTGVGIWSCIGRNQQEVCASLRAGKSGIGYDPARKEYGYRSPLTGIVETPDLKPLLHRRLRIGMPQEAMYAYMAAREAFEQAIAEQQAAEDAAAAAARAKAAKEEEERLLAEQQAAEEAAFS